GIALNPANYDRIVDSGPSANDEAKAAEFKQFWGENKAEVRRFRDGRIIQAVVWETGNNNNNNSKSDRYRIPERIVNHLLAHHFSILPSSVHYIAGQLESVEKKHSVVSEESTNDRRQRVF